ncbi:MAG: protein kinase, partial [Planctomycetes bacterium]|nr:protein kinase [Planctomycetota bacterium]
MNSDRWDRLRSLYDRAEAVAPEEREAFVRRECAGDAELAEEVLDLLALVVPDEFIRPPIIEPGIDTEELPPLEGRQLGEFRVLRRIGSGGGGVVYLAEQPGLHRHVALKFLPRQGRDEKTLERFLRESKLAAALEHPHIVQVYGSGSDENFAWYAMRFVRGGDLAAELERQRAVQQGRFDGPLAWPPFDGPDYIAHAVERLAALAEAIQFAHDRRVV